MEKTVEKPSSTSATLRVRRCSAATVRVVPHAESIEGKGNDLVLHTAVNAIVKNKE